MRVSRMFIRMFLAVVLFLAASCAAAPVKEDARKPPVEEAAVAPPEALREESAPPGPPAPTAPKTPPPPPIGFKAAAEDLSPLRTRIISVSARNTTLRDILYTIADTTGLNLVMEKGVNPDAPVTTNLRNMKAEDILQTVLSSVDYFYEVRDNILIVKLMDTRIFEFGQPSVIQDYSVEVGGDMLGSTKTGSAGVSGNITQKIVSDADSFKFWDSIEKTIGNMLGVHAGAVGAGDGAPGFSVNRMTGTIVVTASKKDLERVETYIQRLKKIMKRQVFVEARIVEVKLTDSLQYGIDWTFLGDNWDGVGSIGLGATKFTDTLSGLPNFNITLTGKDFTLLLKALQKQGNVNVLSNPRVNIMNGQTAFLSVGRKTDFISKVETTSTGLTTASVPQVTFTVETSSVLSGIIFGIVPYISEGADEKISLTISPIISDLVSFENKTIGISGSNTVELSLPTIDLRELSTTVRVRDGDMVIIGGLIQNKDSLQDNNVPVLSKIPLFGYLFKNRDQSSEKTELIIMLRPVLVTEA
ncbi:MAG: pilus (MSHA type) biogenesis protein MshL [Deltaproteobacteria bacterium]|nr:pilus (MSHA type) biogenesis protein MshL [Deltaproteobacteria bacterium]